MNQASKGTPNVDVEFLPCREDGRRACGKLSVQCPVMRMSWKVSGAEVGRQVGGSRFSMGENGVLLSVAQ